MIITFILYIFLILLLQPINSFATWFANDYCNVPLLPGSIIMNNEAINDNERFIKVYRDNKEIHSGDSYIPGETLTVKLSNNQGQNVFEVQNAKFDSGGCSGSRSASRESKLIIDSINNNNNDVYIKGGWATGHSTVHITSDFVLIHPENINNNNNNNRNLRKLTELNLNLNLNIDHRKLQSSIESEHESNTKLSSSERNTKKNNINKSNNKPQSHSITLTNEDSDTQKKNKKKMNIKYNTAGADYLSPKKLMPAYKKLKNKIKENKEANKKNGGPPRYKSDDDGKIEKDDDDEIIAIIAKQIEHEKSKGKLRGGLKYVPQFSNFGMKQMDDDTLNSNKNQNQNNNNNSNTSMFYDIFTIIPTIGVITFVCVCCILRFKKDVTKLAVEKLTGRAIHE